MNLVLKETAAALARGADVAQVEAAGRAGLLQAGFGRVDYFEARGADDLRRLEGRFEGGNARVFAAAWLGRTRLIDNWPVG
jgi:pantoate--beta-alanine ligase